MARSLLVLWWLATGIVIASELEQNFQPGTIQIRRRDSDNYTGRKKLQHGMGRTRFSEMKDSLQVEQPKPVDNSARIDNEELQPLVWSPFTRGGTPKSSETQTGNALHSLPQLGRSKLSGMMLTRTKIGGLGYRDDDSADIRPANQVSHRARETRRLYSRSATYQPRDTDYEIRSRNINMLAKTSRLQPAMSAMHSGTGSIRSKEQGHRSAGINTAQGRDVNVNVNGRAKLAAEPSGGFLTTPPRAKTRLTSSRRDNLFPLLSSSGPLSRDPSRSQKGEISHSHPSASRTRNEKPVMNRSGNEESKDTRIHSSNGYPNGSSYDTGSNGHTPNGRPSPGGGSNGNGASSGDSKGSNSRPGNSKGNGSNGGGSSGSGSGGDGSNGNGSNSNGTDGSGFDGL